MAARPFGVDHARIVDESGCQIAYWVRRNPGSHALRALPACNPCGPWLTAGASARHDGAPETDDARDQQLQVQGMFRELRRNDYRRGLAVGMVRRDDINTNQNLLASTCSSPSLSFSCADDRFALLTKVGRVDHCDQRAPGHELGGGPGGEYYAIERLVLLAQVHGATGLGRCAQAVLRDWLLANRWQLDGSFGFPLDGGNRSEWFTLGFRWITPVFL